ncbi:pyridoxal phosphate-dependent aminotransferase [Streptomyces sp. CAU 1734]|uniref:pyridoxal phosphate-dependent aminotransferase n=1 Tax=Streptomyces sp. CAU 1734 TaxID=3140360 RepID=UPI00326075A0
MTAAVRGPFAGSPRTATDDRALIRRTAVDTLRPFDDPTADWMLDRVRRDLPLYLLHVADHGEAVPPGLREALHAQDAQPCDGLVFSQYGLPELRRRLAEWLPRDEEWAAISDPLVSVTWSGTGAAVFDVLRMLKAARPEPSAVLLPRPGWGYEVSVRDTGHRPIGYEVPAESPLGPEPAHLREAVDRCRREGLAIAGILVNPQHNPWGGNWTPEFLAAVADLAEAERAPVVVDNAFYGLTTGDVRPTSAVRLLDRLIGRELLISVRSLSKQFACSGWALGVMAGSPGLVTAYSGRWRCLREPTANFRAQAAMASWLAGPEPARFTARRKREATRHAGLLRTALGDAGLPGDAVLHHGGAPFALLRPPAGTAVSEVRERVVGESGVLLGVERDAGGREWFKIWLGRDSQIFEPALRALGPAAARLWSPE